MLTWLLRSPVLGLLLGPVVSWLVDELKRFWVWFANQGPTTKHVAAVVLSAALVGLTFLVPGSTPTACQDLSGGITSACQQALASGPFVQSVISAIVAVLTKHAKQLAAK